LQEVHAIAAIAHREQHVAVLVALVNGSSGSILKSPFAAAFTRVMSRFIWMKRTMLSGSRHDCRTSTGMTPASAVYVIITQLAAIAVMRSGIMVFMKNVRNISSEPT
jgi:hypothetical protein